MSDPTPVSSAALVRERARRVAFLTATAWGVPARVARQPATRAERRVRAPRLHAVWPGLVLRLGHIAV